MKLNRNTLLLVIISVAVIAAVFLLNNQQTSAPDNEDATEAEAAPAFPELSAEDVTRLEVVDSATEASVVAERDGEAWTVQAETLADGADPDTAAIDAALGQFVGLEISDRFAAEALADFGLEPPAYTISLSQGDDQTLTLQIGSKNPSSNRYYGLLDGGEDVLLLSTVPAVDGLLGWTTAPPVVAPPTPTPEPVLMVPGPVFSGASALNLVRLTVSDTAQDAQTVLVADAEGNWTIEEATNADAGASADDIIISTLATAFAGLQGRDKLSVDDLATVGLDDAAYSISAEADNGRILSLLVGDADPTGSRFYTLVNDFTDVVLADSDQIQPLLDLIDDVPLLPEATPEATEEASEG